MLEQLSLTRKKPDNNHTGDLFLFFKKKMKKASERGATASKQNDRCESAWDEETEDEGKEGGRADELSLQQSAHYCSQLWHLQRILLTLRIQMEFVASLVCVCCRLGAFPYNAGDKSHWEHAVSWPRSCSHVTLTGILQGNLFLLLLREWQRVSGSTGFVQRAGVRAHRKLSADLRELQSGLWADSHGREMSFFFLQTLMKWCFHRVRSSAYKGLFVAGNPPISPLPKPTANPHPYKKVAVLLLTLGVSGPGPTDTEPVEMESVSDHVLLGLEEDDVHLGREQAAQHNEAAQTHRDAHGGGLHLGESGCKVLCFSMESSEMQNIRSVIIQRQESQSWGFALVQAGLNVCRILIFHNPGIIGVGCMVLSVPCAWCWACPVSLRIRGRLTECVLPQLSTERIILLSFYHLSCP